jgi:hypothetical protein
VNQTRGTDGLYDFKSKSTLIESPNDDGSKNTTEMDLLKAMVRDDLVTGYKVQKTDVGIGSGIAGLNISLTRIYLGSAFNGYVFQIRNETKRKAFEIDLRKLSLGQPNLAIVSQVDDSILGGSGKEAVISTSLRVVAKASATYRDIVLPVTFNVETKE